MTFDFSRFSAVLLDLDGTIYHEDHPLPGAVELIRLLQSRGQPFACLTNSTMSGRFVVDRLSRMGLCLDESKVYTAAEATCDFVREHYAERKRPAIFNLATNAPYELLGDRVDWVSRDDERCDAIIIGAPANAFAGPDRQRIALALARNGAALIGICADRVYPSPRGIELGAGALSTMLAYAAGTTPTFCGKPETIFFTKLCNRLGVEPSQCVIVGDNLESDIAGGKTVGMYTVLTLGGVSRQQDIVALLSNDQPDEIINGLRSLL